MAPCSFTFHVTHVQVEMHQCELYENPLESYSNCVLSHRDIVCVVPEVPVQADNNRQALLSTTSLTLFEVILNIIVLPTGQVLHQSSAGMEDRSSINPSVVSRDVFRSWFQTLVYWWCRLQHRTLSAGARELHPCYMMCEYLMFNPVTDIICCLLNFDINIITKHHNILVNVATLWITSNIGRVFPFVWLMWSLILDSWGNT